MTETYGQRLATLDPETGQRPSSRIGNAGNARSLVQRLKYEDESRMFRYTNMMGLMDGNPPWSSQKLIDIGQGHRANFNLRESEGIVEAAKTPYYDLVFEVPFFAKIEFGVQGAEPHVVDQWGDIFTEEYTDTLSQWNGFDHQIQLHQWQMVVNGIGPLFWPHYIGWHSEAIKCRKVLVPMETKANVDELEMCAVLHSYRADELEAFIMRGGTYEPDGDGWNIPLCKQAIIDSAFREMRQTYGMENYDLYQRAIRTGDLFYGIHRSDRIYVASLFIKEFGGKVSHYMITDSVLGHQAETAGDDLSEETGYLFKRRRKFDSFSQVLCPFFFDSGPDGTWHAIKGLGPKIYDFCDISNRTFCQMLDGAVIGSGITLETGDGNAMEETQISLVGGAAVVAPGYKVVQTRIAEALNGAMEMRRELHGTLQANTGSYRQRTDEGRPEPTLGQAELVQQQQGMLTKGSTNRYYSNFDKWHKETVRRLLDPAQSPSIPGGQEAMEFVDRCVMRGIPAQVMNMKSIKRVISTRSIGYGSPQLRDIATRELVSMIPYMDEVSRNHALRARAASLPGIGMFSVDSFFPPIEKQGVPNAHASMAVLENNALRQPGGKALVEPLQNHSIHFDVHMKDAMAHYQTLAGGAVGAQNVPPQTGLLGNGNATGVMGPTLGMNGGNGMPPGAAPPAPTDPMPVLIHLEQAGPHMAQHLQMLQGDPTRKNEVKQKQQQLDQLGKQTDQLQQQVEESAQAQEQNGNGGLQPGEDMHPEMIPKMTKVIGDLNLKKSKQDFDLNLKQRKQEFSEALADKKTAHGIQLGTAKTTADIGRTVASTGLERARTGQSMGLERAQAQHGMGIERVRTQHGMSLAERKARHAARLAEKKAAQQDKQAKQKPKRE
jgi:hypothetical protein